MGTSYWAGLVDWLRGTVAAEKKIAVADLDLWCVTDDPGEAVEVIVRVNTEGEAPRGTAFT
jgi:predicted Rossmann-fold nucleotide-binding protein